MVRFVFDYHGKEWYVETEKDHVFTCSKCLGPIQQVPFYYCQEFEQLFCKECEFSTARRLCKSEKVEHIHQCIKSWRKYAKS